MRATYSKFYIKRTFDQDMSRINMTENLTMFFCYIHVLFDYDHKTHSIPRYETHHKTNSATYLVISIPIIKTIMYRTKDNCASITTERSFIRKFRRTIIVHVRNYDGEAFEITSRGLNITSRPKATRTNN